MRFALVLCVALGSFESTPATELATLKMQIVTDRIPDKPNKAWPRVFPVGAGTPIDERLQVHAVNHGVRNAVLYVYTGQRRGATVLPQVPPPKNQDRILEISGGRFEPHILVLRAGDTLKVKNRDPVRNNTEVFLLKNAHWGLTLFPGAEFSKKMEFREPCAIPVESNTHPWMRSYVFILEHPFVGVSDENGHLVIEGLPLGDITFRLFHESLAHVEGIIIRGESADLPGNLLWLNLKEGVNDLGRVVIPAECFKVQ